VSADKGQVGHFPAPAAKYAKLCRSKQGCLAFDPPDGGVANHTNKTVQIATGTVLGWISKYCRACESTYEE
jgi:hypothetical protein